MWLVEWSISNRFVSDCNGPIWMWCDQTAVFSEVSPTVPEDTLHQAGSARGTEFGRFSASHHSLQKHGCGIQVRGQASLAKSKQYRSLQVTVSFYLLGATCHPVAPCSSWKTWCKMCKRCALRQPLLNWKHIWRRSCPGAKFAMWVLVPGVGVVSPHNEVFLTHSFDKLKCFCTKFSNVVFALCNIFFASEHFSVIWGFAQSKNEVKVDNSQVDTT